MEVGESPAVVDFQPKSSGSPPTVLTDFDSGIETMDVDDGSQSQKDEPLKAVEASGPNTEEDKRTEKRKRTSSSASEMTDDNILGIIEDIFAVQLLPGEAKERLRLKDTTLLVQELKSDSGEGAKTALDFHEIVSSIIMEVLTGIGSGQGSFSCPSF